MIYASRSNETIRDPKLPNQCKKGCIVATSAAPKNEAAALKASAIITAKNATRKANTIATTKHKITATNAFAVTC